MSGEMMSGSLIVTELMISIMSALCSWTVMGSIYGQTPFLNLALGTHPAVGC